MDRPTPRRRERIESPDRDEEPAIPSILLIRHAQASFGASDYDILSELGHRQVTALVDGLERRRIAADVVISGRLRRQRDTAGLYAAALGLEVEIDPRFDEYDVRDILSLHADLPAGLEHRPGEPELTSREFQRALNQALGGWLAAGADGPTREPWPVFRARLSDAVRGLAGRLGKGETAAVISSGGAIGAIGAELLGLPPEAMITLNHVTVNTGISKLTVGRGGITLVSFNEHAHLDESGEALISYR